MKEILIIGGGIAGLTAANHLASNGCKVFVIEKHHYPRHKVCGEYLSLEVYDYLKEAHLLPTHLQIPFINTLILSSSSGNKIEVPLQLGGFGISRYSLEQHLKNCAEKNGVTFIIDEATDIHQNGLFSLSTKKSGIITADILLGAYGKKTKIDGVLNRKSFKLRSPFVGIKYHAHIPGYRNGCISLHNFSGGYCGISNIEENIVNICYLVHRDKLREAGNIYNLEKNILKQNPKLKEVLDTATSLFEKPLVVNEINFQEKSPVENDIIMLGDTAGTIAPLCGNGMAMAVHSSKMAAEVILQNKTATQGQIAVLYSKLWRKEFSKRLLIGRMVQNMLFGRTWSSELGVFIARKMPTLTQMLIAKTHGKKI